MRHDKVAALLKDADQIGTLLVEYGLTDVHTLFERIFSELRYEFHATATPPIHEEEPQRELARFVEDWTHRNGLTHAQQLRHLSALLAGRCEVQALLGQLKVTWITPPEDSI